MPSSRRLAAIVFTDIEGFTSQAHADEKAALALLGIQEALIAPHLAAHRGRQVKSMGDGLLLEFSNALDAVEWAVAIQREAHEHALAGRTPRLPIRIGVHVGDVEAKGEDILGDAVNIAARLEPLADVGGIALSAQTIDQVRTKLPFRFERVGSRKLKGIDESVDVYRVQLPWLTRESPPSSTLPRLAVLPLTNISPDPKDEYFADGLTEELISVLSRIRGLRVISRTSASQFKGAPKQVSQIGEALGVSSLLEGSVRRSGNRLRITMQLIDVLTDEHRWSQTFDRQLDDIFEIQADVAMQTARALAVELVDSERKEVQSRPTSSLKAYEAYLRGAEGRHRYLEFGGTPKEAKEVIRHFEEALREDPKFANAYSHLADFLVSVSGERLPGSEAFPRARELVGRAIELAPGASDSHEARGHLAMEADQDWTLAEREFREAIALNPSNSEAHFWYGYLLSALQRFSECERQAELAIEVDPLWLEPRLMHADQYGQSGNLEAAIREYEKLVPDYPDNLVVASRLSLLYFRAGRDEESVRALAPLEMSPRFLFRLMYSRLLARTGQPESLRALLQECEARPSSEYLPLATLAGSYALLGEKDRALDLLERDVHQGDRALWAFYQGQEFDSLRSEPRFVELLRELNLPTTLSRPC